MGPYYQSLCEDLNITINDAIYQSIKSNNDKELNSIDSDLENAKKSEGETDISKLLLRKADFFMNIGSKPECIAIYEQIIEDNCTTETKISCLFKIAFVYFYHYDLKNLKNSLNKLEE